MVLLHYATAFAPAIGSVDSTIAHPDWETPLIHSPIFFIADGYLAISLFFLISGIVLTCSFGAAAELPPQILRRLARLGIPMAASVLLGAAWFEVWPHAHLVAARMLGNNVWLAVYGPRQLGLGPILREIVFGGLLLGHAGASLLPAPPGLHYDLPSFVRSVNSPLWTLHVEFYGSLLVLGLVALERQLRPAVLAALCALLEALLLTHPLGLFVLGFGAAKLIESRCWRTMRGRAPLRAFGLIALGLGIATAAYPTAPGLTGPMNALCHADALPMADSRFGLFGQAGAILVGFAVIALPSLQAVLRSPAGRRLGRYSFSLYLVHWPVLFTLTSALVSRLAPVGQDAAILLASAIGLVVTAGLTLLFERWVDAPATRLSRRLGAAG